MCREQSHLFEHTAMFGRALEGRSDGMPRLAESLTVRPRRVHDTRTRNSQDHAVAVDSEFAPFGKRRNDESSFSQLV
jgi:hypothetical protein